MYSLLIKVGYRYIWFIISLLFDFFYGFLYYTPGIIKVPFLHMTAQNPRATYACINLGEVITMRGLEEQSILLDADIGAVLSDLR